MSNQTTLSIIQLYRKYGNIAYGERCDTLSHSFQAGLIAQERGCDDELILAAFLHDIGHLYPLEREQTEFEKMGKYGIEAHDKWGGDFLKQCGFSDRIVATVQNHVIAKRYLCYVDAAYYDQLSEASKQTLKYQGGVMSLSEAKTFEADPFFKDSIIIRKIDEAAKAIDFEVTREHWAYFEELLNQQRLRANLNDPLHKKFTE